MHKLQTSKFLAILMGFFMVASFAAAVISIAVPDAGAQTLTEKELFGGTTGSDFAANAGLGSGDLATTIAQIIRVVLGFLGVVAVFIILMGGFQWMTSGGADEKVQKAKKFMIAGVVGLAIVLAAYAIASFVITSLTGALTNAETPDV
jgi:hypothetical protein